MEGVPCEEGCLAHVAVADNDKFHRYQFGGHINLQLQMNQHIPSKTRSRDCDGSGAGGGRGCPMGLPSSQTLLELFNSYTMSNSQILQAIKPLGLGNRGMLEQFCVIQVQSLPIFLMYQIASELDLRKLKESVKAQLLHENYQQLNYQRMDFLKISVHNFHALMREYQAHVNSLEIQGLRPNDLKSVIEDYCLMADLGQQQKKEIVEKYVECKMLSVGTFSRDVHRSMIEMRKMQESVHAPLKGKNINLSIESPQSQIRSARALPSPVAFPASRGSEEGKKQDPLYLEMLSIRKSLQENKGQKQIQSSLLSLGESVMEMEREIQSQNQKIQKIERIMKSAKEKRDGFGRNMQGLLLNF